MKNLFTFLLVAITSFCFAQEVTITFDVDSEFGQKFSECFCQENIEINDTCNVSSDDYMAVIDSVTEDLYKLILVDVSKLGAATEFIITIDSLQYSFYPSDFYDSYQMQGTFSIANVHEFIGTGTPIDYGNYDLITITMKSNCGYWNVDVVNDVVG